MDWNVVERVMLASFFSFSTIQKNRLVLRPKKYFPKHVDIPSTPWEVGGGSTPAQMWMQIVIMYLALSSGPKGGQGPNFHTQYVEAEGADVGGRGQIYSVVGDKRSDIACTRLFRVTPLLIGLITIVSFLFS